MEFLPAEVERLAAADRTDRMAVEYNPYGAECYGLSQSAMRTWVSSFVNQYHAKTGRWAVIYTTTDWWSTCTGNYSGFWANDPLWVAR